MALLERARSALGAEAGRGEILRACAQGDPACLTTVDLADAARAGDTLGTALVADSGRAIGVAASTIINLLNPDHLIIGDRWLRPGRLPSTPCKIK